LISSFLGAAPDQRSLRGPLLQKESVSQPSIIPFMPDGWAPSAGGFPAMVGNVAFLMKDVVLLAVSFYLLKQDVVRATVPMNMVAEQETVMGLKQFTT
jgi:uncharacterized membrane protein YkgB